MFFPLTPFVIKQIDIPGNGIPHTQALCNGFSKVSLRIMELSNLPAWKDACRSIGSLFIVPRQHIDPDDDDRNVYLRMFLDQYLLHRPGAAQTGSSSGRDQSDESEFVFIEIEVFLESREAGIYRSDHFNPSTSYTSRGCVLPFTESGTNGLASILSFTRSYASRLIKI